MGLLTTLLDLVRAGKPLLGASKVRRRALAALACTPAAPGVTKPGVKGAGTITRNRKSRPARLARRHAEKQLRKRQRGRG
jgi:hypothetical protein